MSTFYNNNDCNNSINNNKSELKIRTSFLQHQPTNFSYYPSPNSPSTICSGNEQQQQVVLSHSPPPSLLQEQQQSSVEDPSLEEWMLLHQNHFNHHHPPTTTMQQQQYAMTETSLSEASSYGIRTPDIGISDIMTSTSNPHQLFHGGYYTSFLQHQPHQHQHCNSSSSVMTASDDIQLIPSLTHQDHMMLLQKGYSDNQNIMLPEQHQQMILSQQHDSNIITHMQQFYYEQQQHLLVNEDEEDSTFLTQLSREQLIERVVQLEMERTKRSGNNMRRRSSSTTSLDQHYNPIIPAVNVSRQQQQQHNYEITLCKQDNLNTEQTKMHSCLWVNCTAQAPTLDRLMTHICESHIGSGKATYFCEWQDCARNKKPFMKRHKMHNHMRTHTGERPFVCTVIGCNKTFSRPDSLSTHIKTHSDIRPYLCQVPGCEKAYFHSRSLRKHIKSSHMKNHANTTSASARNHQHTPSSVTHRTSMILKRQQQKSAAASSSSAASSTNLVSIKLEQNPIIPKQSFSHFYGV